MHDSAAAAYESFLMDSGGGAELRRRYHRLALRLHPDHGGVTELFQAFQYAYHRVKEHYANRAADDDVVDMDWEPTYAHHKPTHRNDQNDR